MPRLFSPEQRAWLRDYLGDLIMAFSASSESCATAAGKPRALFLYGSLSGNAQSLSEGFAEILSQDGWSAEVVSMEHHASVDLAKEPLVLVITSIWGEGDPPENAVEFW